MSALLALAMLAAATGETAPDWSRLPPGQKMISALEQVRSAGLVNLRCEVKADGSTTNCRVESEAPAGAGLGKVALQMAKSFHFTPKMIDGKPVDGGEVVIPIRIQSMAEPPPRVWLNLPTPEQLATVWPAGASATEGRVVLSCTVSHEGLTSDCRVQTETPPGAGFGEAALKLAPGFRFQPIGKKAIAAPVASIPVEFKPPAAAPTLIQNPVWVRFPSGEEMAKVYPRALRGMGVARLRCGVRGDGRLGACHILEESPPDAGLADAVLKLVPLFKLKATTRDGRPVAGGVVDVPVRFVLP